MIKGFINVIIYKFREHKYILNVISVLLSIFFNRLDISITFGAILQIFKTILFILLKIKSAFLLLVLKCNFVKNKSKYYYRISFYYYKYKLHQLL